jgi:hypothetical protein
MNSRRKASRASLLEKFRALPPVIQVITGLLTVVSTALGLLFLLVPGWKPGAGSPTTPTKIVGNLHYLGLEPEVPYGVHLAADRLDSGGYHEQQLKRMGNVVEVSASLGGLKGNEVPLVWSLYLVDGKNKRPVANTQFLNQKAQPIQLSEGGQFVGSLNVWVPIPPFRGRYVARVLILYNDAALNFVDSAAFAGRPLKPSSRPPAAIPNPLVGTECRGGVERWSVKTLADPAASTIDQQARVTSIHDLIGLRNPGRLADQRAAPVELSTYRISARLVEYALEPDSDLHLVVADPKTGETMIVEFPADGCTQGAAAHDRVRMSRARAALLRSCGLPKPTLHLFKHLTGSATISGVGFFDYVHGQTGVAPNGIELHPVVDFQSTNCRNK